MIVDRYDRALCEDLEVVREHRASVIALRDADRRLTGTFNIKSLSIHVVYIDVEMAPKCSQHAR